MNQQRTAAPEVSVVIPCYNCLEYLPRALRSVQAQQFESMEILIVDDGSTDGSGAWLKQCASQDPRIRLIQGGGWGPARARNQAIQSARGRFIALLDADDYWCPGKLHAQHAALCRSPRAVLCFSDYRHIYPSGQQSGTCFEYWPGFRKALGMASQLLLQGAHARAVLLAENVVGTSTVMMRREACLAVGGFDEALDSAEDWDLWLKLCGQGDVIALAKERAGYQMRNNSESARMGARLRANAGIIWRHATALKWRQWPALSAALAAQCSGHSEYALGLGQRIRACVFQAVACALAPSRRRVQTLAVEVLYALRLRKALWQRI